MMNLAGTPIVDSSKNRAGAERLMKYPLSREAPEHFANEAAEYPLISGVPLSAGAAPLDKITPSIDLGSPSDLQQTRRLLRGSGAL
jgi:iron(III) transport system substrate-binding protein